MIRKKLVTTNMLIILITIIALVYVTISNLQGLFYRENAAIYDADINTVFDNVDDIIKSSQQLLVQASIDTQLQSLLKNNNSFPEVKVIKEIQGRLNYYVSSSEQLEILPLVKNKFYEIRDDAFTEASVVNSNYDYGYHWEFKPDNKDCLRVWRYIYNDEDVSIVIGMARLDLNLPTVSEKFDTFGVDYEPNGRLYLLDESDNILLPYGKKEKFNLPNSLVNSLSGTSFSLKDETITVVKEFPENNWQLVAVIQGSSLLSGTKNIIIMIVACGIILILLDFILTLYFTSHITSPILVLSKEMPTSRKADHYDPLPVPKNATSEVKQLYNSYNELIKEVNASLIRVHEATKRQAEDKFLMLQAQINPHFLYNTLNTVNCLAQNGQDEEIQEVIIALVNLFRNTLNNGQPLCTVSQEIEHLSDYLTIMKYRYPNRCVLTTDIEEETKELWITKQILQPLAENALLYGFVEANKKGIIHVSTRIEVDYLVISMSNNGTPANINMIQKLLVGDETLSKSHYGIRNVNERLKSYYGEECGLNYWIDNGKTVVSCRLPLDKLKTSKEVSNG